MESQGHTKIEEMLRLLAGAVNAVRLYPPSSELPAQAIERLVAGSNALTAEVGTVRVTVDPRAFRSGDATIGDSHAQMVSLAEALHAMQIGQLVIAPGLTADEAQAFASVVNGDPRQIRAGGGARSAMVEAGASAIAVIEVSLRTSDEDGLVGVDLLSAPLEQIAQEMLGATVRWHEGAGAADVVDEVEHSIGHLEAAARDIAVERLAAAMMRLSDDERLRILLSSMATDKHATPMRGMLDVIARMPPATLARLLRLASARCGARPQLLAMPLDLPPEVAHEVAALLAPSPLSEAECGVPEDPSVEHMSAEVMAGGGEQELLRLTSMAERSKPGKALVATLALVRNHADLESVRALADALGPAARSGALTTVREALRTIDGLADDL
ncbi:MAG: hypothetical protein RBS78_06885, partial [Coriobacteriia bacterium]|nr:hypothetical protein [Coriobacteriia bacterium]